MPVSIWQLEWLNANAQRRYPLTADSSGRDDTGSFQLPNSFLVHLDFPVHAGMDVDPSRFFLKQLGVYATGFSITIGYSLAEGGSISVASAVIPRDSHTPNTSYALGGMNDFADSIGRVTIGSLDEINKQPSGLFNFSLANARIEPDCIRPMLRGVSAIYVRSTAGLSQPIYGDVELVAETNMRITTAIVEGQRPQIQFSAISGEGLSQPETCSGNENAPCIRRINGIPPTPSGDFALLAGNCISIQSIQNGLRISDMCAEPCCGCEELEAITRDLEQFGSKAATLENFITRLDAVVTQLNQITLSSRLSDRGCSS